MTSFAHLAAGHGLRKLLRRIVRPAWLGTLRRTTPLSDNWGNDRGTPTDRYYIERFLDSHKRDIRGHALEVQDSTYSDRYGSEVKQVDVLDVLPTNPRVTIIADLSAADVIPSNSFDCFILTQTLQLIYDVRSAIAHSHRILRPGGVLLVTVPSVTRVGRESGTTGDYWRFTVESCSLLFGERFGAENVAVRSYGNVLSAIAFLAGMAQEELSRKELEFNDESFPLIIAVRALKR
ncbi:MAG: methyltransferase domain-containing protein [Terriglobia bacterium]